MTSRIMDEDDLEYLQPGFDLNSLRVANLRNLLVQHDVSFPSSAKKAELVQLVSDEILPQRKKLLARAARVKRTSKGIVDVPSSQESTLDGENDEAALMPPPETPKRTSRRRATEDPPDTTARKAGRTPSRKGAPAKHPRASDPEESTDMDQRPTSRKARKSHIPGADPPAVKVEEPDSPPRSRRGGNFSSENPFQSGSSPPTDGGSSSKTNRRQSSLSASREDRRKSTSRPRKTRSPAAAKVKQEDGIEVPSRRTFEVPISRLRGAKPENDDGVEAGEEFTPEEQLALVRERAQNGHQDLLPPQRKNQSRALGPISKVSKAAPWVVILGIASLFAGYWRHEKIEIGYCGVGKPSWSLVDSKVPEWVHTIQPECEPCPPHAYCQPDFVATCEQDFILKQHPLSLFGVWPLPPTCEPDGEKARRVQAVAERAVNELRERRAKWECGQLVDETGKVPNVEIAEDELKQEVSKKRRRGMTEQEFEELWQGALGEIMSREEVVSDTHGTSHVTRLTSTSLARIPFNCALKRSLRLTLARYRLHLAGLIVCAWLIATVLNWLQDMRSDSTRVPELVALTLDRLATQAALHSNGRAPESFISVVQLRDDILRGEFSAKRREKVWKGVRNVIEDNTNVRAAVRESRSGEVSRVWEWIGDTGNIEIDDRRTSGKLTWANGESPSGNGTPEIEMRKWDEGRPIF